MYGMTDLANVYLVEAADALTRAEAIRRCRAHKARHPADWPSERMSYAVWATLR